MSDFDEFQWADLMPRSSVHLSLDEELTAILDAVRGNKPRAVAARELLESVLREKAVMLGAAPVGPEARK